MSDIVRQAESEVARGCCDPAAPKSGEGLYSYDTTLISGILRTKRKARSVKACFPCRSRKVRCDGRVPCTSCVQRDHASLCRAPVRGLSTADRSPPSTDDGSNSDYAQLVSTTQSTDVRRPIPTLIATTQPRTEATPSRTASLHLMVARMGKLEEELSLLRDGLIHLISREEELPTPEETSVARGTSPQLHTGDRRTTDVAKSSGKFCVDIATGTAVFLGSHSDPPSVLGCFQPSSDYALDCLLPDNLMPKTYAFENLWAEVSVPNVCRTFPEDSDILRYWEVYRTLVHPFYPALATVDSFGHAILTFLDSRSFADREALELLYSKTDPSWLALLFAVLACGAQFSDDTAKDRDLRSKVFVCSSFQCLRASNLLSYVSGDQIQAMALIGICLRNNLDMNGAWVIMGSTIRLAQSIGLHETSDPARLPLPPPQWVLDPAPYHFRLRLWWILVWQDTFLSVTYDRPPSCIFAVRCALPQYPRTGGVGKSFADSISRACQIVLDRIVYKNYVAPHTDNNNSFNLFLQYKNRFELVLEEAPINTDKEHCTTLQGRLEHLTLQIHVGYCICRLYLELLQDHDQTDDYPARESLQADYTSRVGKIIESFLQLIRLSPSVCRSWPLVHNTVSPVIAARSMLGRSQPAILQGQCLLQLDPLVRRLVEVLEKEEEKSRWCDEDDNVRVIGPYTRVLRALKEANTNPM